MNTTSQTGALSVLGTYALLMISGALLAGVYACAHVAAQQDVPPFGVLTWQLLFSTAAVGGTVGTSGHGESPAAGRGEPI